MRARNVMASAALAAGLMSGPAWAELVHFEYKGSVDLSFDLDRMPTPEYPKRPELDFERLKATINGVARVIDLEFYPESDGGGFYVLGRNPNIQVNTFGDQIYGGDVAHPVFTPTLTPFVLADSTGSVTGTLSISLSAVPLPTSAPMFGAALIALGAVGRGLKRTAKNGA